MPLTLSDSAKNNEKKTIDYLHNLEIWRNLYIIAFVNSPENM